MKIFGWMGGFDGCGFYRIQLPLLGLAKLGHETKADTRWDMFDDVWANPNVLVGQRMTNAPASRSWIQLCQSGRMRCVYEIDDDIFSVDPSSAASGWNDSELQMAVCANATAAHLVTVTTPRLAEIFGELNPNVSILPNTIPKIAERQERKPHPGVNIGWGGSATHQMDFAGVAESIVRAADRRKHASLVVTGPDYLPAGRERINRPWQAKVPDWWATLADIDIGIAPLAHHPFNDSKSFIKILEYAAHGIPFVASNTGPYAANVQHGITGFLADTPAEWDHYLTALIRDGQLRSQMGRAGRLWARQYTTEKWAPEYERVYANG